MATASRKHNIEIWSRSRVGVGTDSLELEIDAMLTSDGNDVHCDEIDVLTLILKTAADGGTVRIDVDCTQGIGVGLAESAALEVEEVYAGDVQEIAEEISEICESQYEDHEISWHKEYGRSR